MPLAEGDWCPVDSSHRHHPLRQSPSQQCPHATQQPRVPATLRQPGPELTASMLASPEKPPCHGCHRDHPRTTTFSWDRACRISDVCSGEIFTPLPQLPSLQSLPELTPGWLPSLHLGGWVRRSSAGIVSAADLVRWCSAVAVPGVDPVEHSQRQQPSKHQEWVETSDQSGGGWCKLIVCFHVCVCVCIS